MDVWCKLRHVQTPYLSASVRRLLQARIQIANSIGHELVGVRNHSKCNNSVLDSWYI